MNADQLVRASSSVGANYRAACRAKSIHRNRKKKSKESKILKSR